MFILKKEEEKMPDRYCPFHKIVHSCLHNPLNSMHKSGLTEVFVKNAKTKNIVKKNVLRIEDENSVEYDAMQNKNILLKKTASIKEKQNENAAIQNIFAPAQRINILLTREQMETKLSEQDSKIDKVQEKKSKLFQWNNQSLDHPVDIAASVREFRNKK